MKNYAQQNNLQLSPRGVIGAANLWHRFDRYELLERDGITWIIPSEKSRKFSYKPFFEREVLVDFLKIGKVNHDHQIELQSFMDPNDEAYPEGYAQRDAQAALRFCNKYGLLGLMFHYHDHINNLRYEGEREFSEYSKDYFPSRKPAAKEINRLLDDDDDLRGYAEPAGMISFFAFKTYYTMLTIKRYIANRPGLNEKVSLPWDWGKESKTWFEFFMDLKIKDVTMMLLPNVDFEMSIQFIGRSLYDLLEMMGFMELSSSTLCLCAECSSPFLAKDPRALYCNETCSARFRKRRLRAKAKQASAKGEVKTEVGLSSKPTNKRRKQQRH